MHAAINLIAALGATGLAFAGCDDPAPECAGVQSAGLIIEIADADSGDPLCDATVHLEHESYSEELVSDGLDPCRYLGGNVPGEYTIDVAHDGHESRSVTVEVDAASNCTGVDTREVSIELNPE